MLKTVIHRPNSAINDAWLNLGSLDGVEIENPLIGRSKDDIENPGQLEVALMRNPLYLSFAAKVLLDIDVLPEQALILRELWTRPFPMYIASRGFGKSFLMALYATLRCALVPGTKVVCVGAAFRQSRVIFEYMDTIWRNAPVLRSVCTSESGPRQAVDRCTVVINDSSAIFVPLGDGSKIRGLRAHIILADEFASIPPAIYETVVAGFAAVSAKPIDNVKEYARRQAMRVAGTWSERDEVNFALRASNQCVISGTADYDFMHYADYWRKQYVYVKSDNDPDKIVTLPGGEVATLKDFFQDGVVPESFNSRDYSIIRIPYEMVPKGFMDDKVVSRAKASMDRSIYLKEYGACFPKDSDGFFRRSMIEACVAKEQNMGQDSWPEWCPAPFDPALRGRQDKKYVIGIDPAASEDNFALVVLELWPEHTRVVYAWSTNLKDFQERKKTGMTKEQDYYAFCARKIRNLSKVFPTDDIVIDMQGGGTSIVEALHDGRNMEHGEAPFWITNELLYPTKELDSDSYPGRHIIHPFQFANYQHCSDANHNARKDFVDKVILFPRFDTVQLELAVYQDKEMAQQLKVSRVYDTLEDAVMEIEELKNELCTIVMTRTGTGVNARDRWDTPETTTAEGKKTYMRKDRYSAFVMANYVARSIQRAPAPVEYNVVGGFAHQMETNQVLSPNMYEGPEWFVKAMENQQLGAVRKKGV